MPFFDHQGIEYAIAQRWQPPQPVWNHSDTCQPNRVRRASHFGEICAQIHPLNGKFHGSERCLYLNVWTPRLDLTVSCLLAKKKNPQSFSNKKIHLSRLIFLSWCGYILVLFNLEVDMISFNNRPALWLAN